GQAGIPAYAQWLGGGGRPRAGGGAGKPPAARWQRAHPPGAAALPGRAGNPQALSEPAAPACSGASRCSSSSTTVRTLAELLSLSGYTAQTWASWWYWGSTLTRAPDCRLACTSHCERSTMPWPSSAQRCAASPLLTDRGPLTLTVSTPLGPVSRHSPKAWSRSRIAMH